MSTIAIGDIHGNRAALDDLMAKLLPEIRSSDTIVFLGDYIDRGADTRGCIDRIVELKYGGDFNVITLMGNHEQWMLRTLHDHTKHSWLVGMGALETITSYSTHAAAVLRKELEDTGPRLFTEEIALSYHCFFDCLPASHLRLFGELVTFYRSPDVLCVHGGTDLNGKSAEETDADTLIWGPDGWPWEYRGSKTVVYGHSDNVELNQEGWPQPRLQQNGTVGIDTISRGILSALRFPELTLYQSRAF